MKCWKDVLFRLVTSVGQRKTKFWVPMRKRTSDLRIPRSDALMNPKVWFWRFDSLWGLIIFSLSHARDKTKKNIFSVFTKLKKLTISLISIYKRNIICCRNNIISNLNKNSSICFCCSTTRSFKCGFFSLVSLFVKRLQMGRVKLKKPRGSSSF